MSLFSSPPFLIFLLPFSILPLGVSDISTIRRAKKEAGVVGKGGQFLPDGSWNHHGNTLTIPEAIQSRETGKIPWLLPTAPSSLCSTSHQPNPGTAQMTWEPRKVVSQNQVSYIKFPHWCNRVPQT